MVTDSDDRSSRSADMYDPLHVMNPGIDQKTRAQIVIARNSDLNESNPSVFSLIAYPPFEPVIDNAEWITVNSWYFYRDSADSRQKIVAVGYRVDSAFVVKFDPLSEDHDERLLIVGEDGVDDDEDWTPMLGVSGIFDYDYDGKQEAFIYLDSQRELNTRYLFCVELTNLDIEWSLPVSSTVDISNGVFSCLDSLNPSVMFASKNPFQGCRDENFNDNFGYLSKVNRNGDIVFNKIASVGIGAIRMIPADRAGEFFVMHDVPFTDPSAVAGLPDSIARLQIATDLYYISRVDRNGKVLKTVTMTELPRAFWLQSHGASREPMLFVKYLNRVIRCYNMSLVKVAESDAVEMDALLGTAQMENHGEVFVYSDGIYSSHLQRIVAFPFRASYFEPVMYDAAGNVSTIAICSTSMYVIGNLVEKSFAEKLTIFYDSNRNYILVILIGMIVILAVTLFYSRRTKRLLEQIRRQKDELQRTHEALIEAQETIVAQEKFRQAKDIAGGFAHEIRNALFPARSALSKLKSADEEKLHDATWLKDMACFTDEAVERAVDMTQLISQYTKLEFHREPEEVNIGDVISEVLRLLQFRIEEQGVDVRMSGVEGQMVEGNKEQFQIALNNVIVNALDALTGIDDSTILITLRRDQDYVSIKIEDNGPGIPDSEIEKVFDVFYSTKPDTGTGLGLAMVKKIIEMYGGSVKVSCQVDVGTAFDLKLKLYQEN